MSYVPGGPGDDDLYGTDDADDIRGYSGNDTLHGLGGADQLDGGEGNDVLIGGGGGDLLTGGVGADTFVVQALSDSVNVPGGFDIITDFEHGIDKIDFVPAGDVGDIFILHDDEGSTGLYYQTTESGPQNVLLAFHRDVEPADILTSVARSYSIYGSSHDDVLVAGPSGDGLVGNAGDDQLFGGAGQDQLQGGPGADFLQGGPGRDVYDESVATSGPDNGYDFISGFETGTDTLKLGFVTGPYVYIKPLDGGLTGVFYDLVDGVAHGVLTLSGSIAANDIELATTTADASLTFIQDGTPGNDVLVGGYRADALRGGDGADYLVGGGGPDLLEGGPGADVFAYATPYDSETRFNFSPEGVAPSDAYDSIVDFEHGVDKIDLSRVGYGEIAIIHDGAGHSYVYFDVQLSGQAGDGIYVVGDVEAGDLIAPDGAIITTYEGFPASAEAYHELSLPAAHRDREWDHLYLS